MGDRTAKKRGGEAKWENEKIYNSKMREGRKSSQQGRGLWWEASGEANDTQETRGPGRGDRHMAKETVNNARSSKALWVKVEEDAVLADAERVPESFEETHLPHPSDSFQAPDQ